MFRIVSGIRRVFGKAAQIGMPYYLGPKKGYQQTEQAWYYSSISRLKYYPKSSARKERPHHLRKQVGETVDSDQLYVVSRF